MSFLKSIALSIRDTNTYIDSAVRAVSDGALSETEISELRRIAMRLKLSPGELASAHQQVVERYALHFMEDRVITELEATKLQHLCTLLGVQWSSLKPEVLAQVNRCIALQKIAQGQLPIIDKRSLPVNLGVAETVHFAVLCATFATRTVARSSSGGFGGVRVRIAKGVSVGLGGYKGHSVPIQQSVKVSEGLLLITSTHARYFGTKHGFQKPWSKIAGVQVFEDGIAFFFTDRVNASMLHFGGPVDPAMVEAIVSYLIG